MPIGSKRLGTTVVGLVFWFIAEFSFRLTAGLLKSVWLTLAIISSKTPIIMTGEKINRQIEVGCVARISGVRRYNPFTSFLWVKARLPTYMSSMQVSPSL